MTKKVAVIGLGYVGLGIAINASKNFDVVGLDLIDSKVNLIISGKSYIEGISDEVIRNSLMNDKFKPTSDPTLIADSNIVVICVPTPLDKSHNPDLSFVEMACDLVASNLKSPALIINESTSYPGTLRDLIARKIEESSGIKHEYASSPERVDPGNDKWNLGNTPRLISGLTESATKKAVDFYSTFAKEIVVVASPEVAETAKLFENTFRQVNIALVNELAIICKSLGINVHDVIDAANTKPYGFMKFNPGPGVGGHCIPVDPTYLAYRAEQSGVKARFIDLANKVNLDMPNYVVNQCNELVGGLSGKKVLIAGVSYKPNIADVRETPAELIREELKSKGAIVSWYDPIVNNWEDGKVEDLKDKSFDLVIFQTIHANMDVEKIKGTAEFVFDCTGKLSGVATL